MQKSTELTPCEQGWLGHLRRAQEQGVSLVEYAQTAGVKVGSLYEARHSLRRKGVQLSAAAGTGRKAPPFIAVQIADQAPSPTAVVCRLRHRLGWEIECGGWPPASWVVQIFGGGAHDTP
jgi:hypothetical protein